MKKLFIGQLAFETTDTSLRTFFDKFDSVRSVKVITDPATSRSRGFGFVELYDSAQAEQAISELDGTMLDGREVVVNEARPRTERSGAYRY